MTNMITVAPGFQYSINIGYDLWNDDKLSRFIPTKSAFKLLEEILLSTDPCLLYTSSPQLHSSAL